MNRTRLTHGATIPSRDRYKKPRDLPTYRISSVYSKCPICGAKVKMPCRGCAMKGSK